MYNEKSELINMNNLIKEDIQEECIINNNAKDLPPLEQQLDSTQFFRYKKGVQVEIYYRRIAKYLIDNWHIVGNPYEIYRYIDGYYIPVEISEIARFLDPMIINEQLFRTSNFKELYNMTHMLAKSRELNSNDKYICFQNGLWDIENRKLIPHNPNIIQFEQSPIICNYNPSNNIDYLKGTRFKEFLDSSVNKEDQRTLQQFAGLVLAPQSKKVQKCLIVTGDGSNGKSVYLNIISNLIDTSRIGQVDMCNTDKEFKNSTLKNCKANIVFDDRSTRCTVNGNWKCLIGGDPITIEEKNRPVERIPSNTTCIYSFNTLPSFAEKTDAIYRRIIVVNFPNKFGTQEDVNNGRANKLIDINLEDDIIREEMDIVLQWALDGLYNLIDNNYKVYVSNTSKENLEVYKINNNNALKWIVENLEVDDTLNKREYRSATTWYSEYKMWCDEEGIKTSFTKSNFIETLKNKFPKYAYTRSSSKQITFGLKLKSEKSDF